LAGARGRRYGVAVFFAPGLSSFSSVVRSFALRPAVPVPVLVSPGVVVVAAPPGVTAPALVVGTITPPLGVVAGPVGVVAPGTVAAGVVGVLAPGTTAVVVGVAGVTGVLAAGAATVVVVVAALDPEPPASLTSAAASTPSASTAMIAIAAIGPFQLGVAASRVRAAAPQRRHQSWSGFSGAPQSGHASGPGTRTGANDPVSVFALPVVLFGGAAATVTSRLPAGG
jgi:hypothetical protein